jgi:protocatechuate 3,4-dioxygenase beta subunit
MKPYLLVFSLAALILLAACNQLGDSEDAPAIVEVTEQAGPTVETENIPATGTGTPQTTPIETVVVAQPTANEGETLDEPTNTTLPPTATIAAESTEPALVPIEVTYFTPEQGEGPYYTVNKPDDRDNDLTVLEGGDGAPAGEVIEFGGKVYDATGMPVSGAVIEIWQTDNDGVYLHPNDPGTDQRDRNFQFYGESVTTADGSYSFRTVFPGLYEPRPRHIHVKVKLEGQELLTTQFYFEGDPELANESMFNQTDSDGVHLIIGLFESQDANGNPILVGQRDIILRMDLSQN